MTDRQTDGNGLASTAVCIASNADGRAVINIYACLLTFTIGKNLDVTRKVVSVIIIPECLLQRYKRRQHVRVDAAM